MKEKSLEMNKKWKEKANYSNEIADIAAESIEKPNYRQPSASTNKFKKSYKYCWSILLIIIIAIICALLYNNPKERNNLNGHSSNNTYIHHLYHHSNIKCLIKFE